MKEYKYPLYIEELRKRGSILGLDSIRRLMEILGHPEEELSVIHIAGTNGKGSVLAFLSSILQCAGCRTGCFISPTIACYEERFQINGRFIDQETLESCFSQVWEAIEAMREDGQEGPTLFEAETALAFLYFYKEKVDYVLLETGMGGASDATNLVRQPLLSVLTSVSLDHRQFLGDTPEEIARVKAGIIKPGCPVVVSENSPEVIRVFRQRALALRSPFRAVDPDEYRVLEETWEGSRFLWKNRTYSIALPGRHQISNGVTALAAAELLKETAGSAGKITDRSLWEGLRSTVWPGRLEIIKRSPVLIRDGAHNPDGARKLADYLQKHFTNRTIIYIMGVLRDKDYPAMLKSLLPLGRRLYAFKPDNPRGLPAGELGRCAGDYDVLVTLCDNVRQALGLALERASREDVLILCGSLSFMEEMGDLDAYRSSSI